MCKWALLRASSYVCADILQVMVVLDFLQVPLLANSNPEPYGEGAPGKCHPCISQIDNRIIQDSAQQASVVVSVQGM